MLAWLRLLLACAAALGAAPALADKLTFDHLLSPALKAALDDKDPKRIAYNAANPKYVTDLIAVRGKSAQDWREALVIIVRAREGKLKTAAAWEAELRTEAARRCAALFTPIAQDAASTTFARRSSGCPDGYPAQALYRVVAGPKSLFLLAAMSRDAWNEKEIEVWRAVLASARID